ncbi:MAG: class I SAM-dependent methyltransferase [Gemmatimonadetes bacterium]|nr:class I SAM-dependent methyltransferase [Gemmatimonadota bacterium]
MLARPVAVGLVAAATLVYEVLLVRLFAIAQFHHFAYMAIGVAMLGFGASGTALALAGEAGAARNTARLAWSATLTPFALLLSPALATRIPLDATQLAVHPHQWPLVVLLYAILALPFAGAALVILLVLALEVQRPGLTYGASFLGAGVGALLSIALLWLLPLPQALSGSALIAAVGAIALLRTDVPRPAPVLAWAALAAAAVTTARPVSRLQVSPYKGLPQVEAYPGARRVAQSWSPLGWVVAVNAPAFRFAPGLSLTYEGEVPPQTALFLDGELSGTVAGGRGVAPAFANWLPSSLAYALGGREQVAVIAAGGGLEVSNALGHGAARVTAVELLPEVARLAAPPPGDARVRWMVQDGRTFAARTGDRYDLVTLGPAGGPGNTIAGVRALSEDFLHTTDAYRAYLRLLRDGGVLAITRWLSVPPREPVRVVLAVAEALRREGHAVDRALVVSHSWATVTVLAKPNGFTAGEVASIRAWTTQRRMDVDWYPGVTGPTSEFHRLDEPVLFLAARQSTAGEDSSRTFARRYPFDVGPRSDARPYPHHFVRPAALRTFLAHGRGDWLPFSEWGVLALFATLAQSLVAALALLIVPALVAVPPRGRPGFLRLACYFGLIGFAYLAAELAVIQQLSLLLGHPVYAVGLVLAGLLVGSGLGSIWSDRQALERPWLPLVLLTTLSTVFAALLLHGVHTVQATPLLARAGVALAALAPLAFLMGLPFVTGLRRLAGTDGARIAWAWAANGFASVTAAPVAALIALEAGSQTLFLAAAGAYGAAALLLPSTRAVPTCSAY